MSEIDKLRHEHGLAPLPAGVPPTVIVSRIGGHTQAQTDAYLKALAELLERIA